MCQIQPLWRADRTTSGAIARLQGVAHIFRLPCAGANPFQRADETAHLIMQKAAGAHMETEFMAMGVINLFDAQFVQCFDR